jgi:hypothetical protein
MCPILSFSFHAFLGMSFISFFIAHILFLMVTLKRERVVMKQYEVLFCGWMDEGFATSGVSIACGGNVYMILIMRV